MSIIGIDFGTTKTIAAIYRDNHIEIIPDTRGRLTIPSLVLVTPEEEIFVGWEAKLHPQRYVSEHITINSIKRVLGKEQDCSWGNWKTHPQEIAALILARLKIEVEAYLGHDVTDAVIAIPAHFDINQRWAVKQAAEIAGFKVRRLINEATAAATLYFRGANYRDGRGIVVDIGGGTTDVSIVEYGDDVIEVKSTAGEHNIGGDDFDQLIIDYLKGLIRDHYDDLEELGVVQEFVLRNAATTAKLDLTDSLSTRIYLPAFIKRNGKIYDDLDFTLTRDHFNQLIDPFLKRIISLIEKAQNNSGITTKQIDTLILVGGTSRIPKIKEIISQRFGLKPRGDIDPEQCVARGAAVIAGLFQGNTNSLLLLDTYQSSLSVESSNGVAEVIIEKDSTLPTKRTKEFTVGKVKDGVTNWRDEIEIRFYEGENKLVSHNTYLGKLVFLEPLQSVKRYNQLSVEEFYQIEVTIDIDPNGTITASAKDKSSNKETRAVLSSPFRLNAAQFNVMRQAVSEAMKSHVNK